MVGWLVNNESERNQSWPNHGTTGAFGWNDWQRSEKTSVRLAGVLAMIQTRFRLNTSLCHYHWSIYLVDKSVSLCVTHYIYWSVRLHEKISYSSISTSDIEITPTLITCRNTWHCSGLYNKWRKHYESK
jgi:hypothetical protein